jgi:hypothetical protein
MAFVMNRLKKNRNEKVSQNGVIYIRGQIKKALRMTQRF